MNSPEESTITAPGIEGMTPGEIVERLGEIRDEKANLKEQEQLLNGEERDLKFRLLHLMEEQGGATRIAFGDLTATRTERIVPIINDWDEFAEYVLENQALHMLQRRVSAAAFGEMYETGQEVPGLAPFNKVDISLRKTR